MKQKSLINLKKVIVQSAFTCGEAHIPSAFSILDILWILYHKILNINPNDPKNPQRDWFILSKGQASLGLYVVLAEKGFFPVGMLDTYGTYDSILGGHPDRNKVPGVEASTGSLGHGFPMAVGVAKSLKIQGIKSRVFVLIGDGECNEGTIWESALIAAHHKLDNLCCIIDFNHSTDRALILGDLAGKFRSFGWRTIEINGHNHNEIYRALKNKTKNMPYAIVANTIKGHGSKSMENNPAWHHRAPNVDELKTILAELY